jgi:hypothetical protein
MIEWFRRIFSSDGHVPSARLHSPRTQQPIPSVRALVTEPNARQRAFTSPLVRQLWDENCDYSHPDYPFLHKTYSPSSNMPVADFTLWVADRLGENDWPSIRELLACFTFSQHLAAIERTFRSYDYGRFIEADRKLLLELQAIAILSYRIGWMGHEDTRTSLLRWLFQESLGCFQFSIRLEAMDRLLEGANKLIRRRNKQMKAVRASEPPLTPERLFVQPLAGVSEAGVMLRSYPPTFRSCITYSMKRGSYVIGTINPQLDGDYTLRQYGLSADNNRRFFLECGLFEPASNVRALADRLTKDELVEIGVTTGVAVLKSWRKDRLLDVLLSHGDALAKVKVRTAADLLQRRPETAEAFGTWRSRVLGAENVALCLACV